jgi:hypothetical protein
MRWKLFRCTTRDKNTDTSVDLAFVIEVKLFRSTTGDKHTDTSGDLTFVIEVEIIQVYNRR